MCFVRAIRKRDVKRREKIRKSDKSLKMDKKKAIFGDDKESQSENEDMQNEG